VAGVYCARCLCQVILDSDSKSCSNCGTILIGPGTGTVRKGYRQGWTGPPAGHVPRKRGDRHIIQPPPQGPEPSDAEKSGAMIAAPPTAPPRPPARKRSHKKRAA